MNGVRILTAAALGIAIFGGAACAQEGVTLVRDGKATCLIMAAEKISPSEKWAVEEFRSAIKEMSGAEIPVYPPNAKLNLKGPTAFIWIGARSVAGVQPPVKLDGLGTDGYVIRTAPDQLIIAGGEERGTMYGVFTALEKLGCRWWTPTESTIPKMKTIVVPPTDLREVPKLEYRDMMYQEVFSERGRAWCARNKVNGMAWSKTEAKYGGRYEFVGNLVHSYMSLLRKSGHEIKPEMQAFARGKRTMNQPCLTNPDTVAAMVDAVVKELKANPNARFVVVGQQDNRDYCRCPNCSALAEREESQAGPVIDFANRVAAEVEKQVPGACIATAAYEWSRKPPKTIRPRDNVFITLCSIECDFAHPLAAGGNEVNKAFKEDIEGWGKIARKLYIWDYTTNFRHFLWPHPNLDVLTPNIKFFADHHAAGVFEQGAHTGRGSDLVGLHMWVLAKSLWNPDADGPALIDEFVKGYYGAAAPAIRKYIDALHRPGREKDFVMRIYAGQNVSYMTPEVMAECEAALREAEKAAAGEPVIERRVRHAHMGVRYVLAKRGPFSATWKAAEARVGKIDFAALADAFVQTVKENNINADAAGEVISHWAKWLPHYGELVADGKEPVPPELEGAAPGTYRLIQACQMDSRARWWAASEGASDGWAVEVPTVAWTVRQVFSPWDDYTPGKKYKLFVRVKGSEKKKDGNAFYCGLRLAPKQKQVRVNADDLADGRYHTFEVCEWDFGEKSPYFWIALTGDGSMSKVFLDCLWLVPEE